MMLRTWIRNGAVVSALSVLAALAGQAQADPFVNRVNDLYKPIQADRRSDTTLFPLLVKMTPPPAAVRRAMDAALLPASRPAFKDAAAWATAEPQKAVLAALEKVTSEQDWKKAFAIAQPYGFDGVDPDLVTAGAYSELGDPPTLLGASFGHIRFLDRAEALAHVEATRLAAEGKGKEALDVLFRLLLIGRQMADRAFLTEKQWGFRCMNLALERMRDVAYTDTLAATPGLNADHLREAVARLVDRAGILGTERLDLPRGDRIGAEQMIARVFSPGGGPREESFAPVLGRARATDRPLRLFSETGRWAVLGRLHAGEADTKRQLDALFNDWNRRWALPPFDSALRLTSEFDKMDRVRFAALDQFVAGVGGMFDERTHLRAELAATRVGLALAGFVVLNKTFPPSIAAIRPAFINRIDSDPFEREGRVPEMFVPGRRANDTTKTHEVTVFPADGQSPFAATLTDRTFVLYLCGPDGAPNGARRATQMVSDPRGDYLAWPPVLSLMRQRLADENKLP
jgi:hypothetical protein